MGRLTPIQHITPGTLGAHLNQSTMSVRLFYFKPNLSIHLQRPHHLPSHRRSSSPRRYMAYDRYVPSRSSPRSGPVWSNNYRPDSPPTSGRYHGDTPNLARSPSPWTSSKLTPNPYRRSPSPERHFTSHVPGVDPRDSSTAWLETSKQERQPSSPAPSLSRDRGRRGSILATRMFEPSDSWKQNHSDRRDDT